MSVRQMRPEGVREWLGAGQVMPAMKRPAVLPGTPAQQPNLDQVAHDRWMTAQTTEQRAAMVRGLGKLARSKLGDLPPEEGV